PVEAGRGHADDGERMFVHEHGAAHHAAIILETRVPARVAEHNIGSAVRAMLVGGAEEMAEIWLNAQNVEVVPAHEVDPGAGRIFSCVEARLSDVVGGQTIKAAVAVAKFE